MKVVVSVHVRKVVQGTRKARELLTQWPIDVETRLRRAAEEERDEHTYRNQTGHLEESTKAALVEETDNRLEVELTMGEEYASHVVARGVSRFPHIATEAEADINRMAARLAKKLGAL